MSTGSWGDKLALWMLGALASALALVVGIGVNAVQRDHQALVERVAALEQRVASDIAEGKSEDSRALQAEQDLRREVEALRAAVIELLKQRAR